MYVHKDFQRQGIAQRLLFEIETMAAKQNNTEIYSYVSKTAKSFFEKNGYKHFGFKINTVNNIEFSNHVMKKEISKGV